MAIYGPQLMIRQSAKCRPRLLLYLQRALKSDLQLLHGGLCKDSQRVARKHQEEELPIIALGSKTYNIGGLDVVLVILDFLL